MNSGSAVIQLVSGILALVSVAGGIFTAVRSGKDRRERETDRRRIDAERSKLGAEEDKIKNEAAEIAIRALRTELDAAYKDIERRRAIMTAQDLRIDEQDKTIRAQSRRIADLEDLSAEQCARVDRLEQWVSDYRERFQELGVQTYVNEPIGKWRPESHSDREEDDP